MHLEFGPKETKEQLKSKLFSVPPERFPADYQNLHRAWQPETSHPSSSSSGRGPTIPPQEPSRESFEIMSEAGLTIDEVPAVAGIVPAADFTIDEVPVDGSVEEGWINLHAAAMIERMSPREREAILNRNP